MTTNSTETDFRLRDEVNALKARIAELERDANDVREELRRSEERYRCLTEATAQIVWTTNAEGNVVRQLPTWEAFTGQDSLELVGAGWLEHIHPDDRERVVGVWAEAMAERRLYETDVRVRRRDGVYRHLWVRGVPVLEDDGSIREWVGISTDVTERMLAQEQLRNSERRFRTLIDHGWDALVLTDADGIITFVSHSTERIVGFSPEEMMGKNILTFVWPDDFAEASSNFEELLRQPGKSTRVSLRNVHRDGRPRWFDGVGTNLLHDPTVRAVVCNVRDVTEKRAAEERLRANQKWLQTLIANIPGAVYRCGYAPDWTVQFISDAVEWITGYPAAEFIENRVRDYVSLIHPEDWPGVERTAREALERGASFEVEYRIRHAAGSTRWVNDRAQGVYDGAGELLWVGGVVFDITERKRADAALREHAARLQDLSRRVVEVQEEERRRLARELHDEIGQVLSAVSVNLKIVRGKVEPAGWPRLDESIAIVDRAVDQVRNLSLNLRPSVLDDFGLEAALRWCVNRLAEPAGLSSTFTAAPLPADLSYEVKNTCFRVAQEALTNLVRHAGASKVHIDLRAAEDHLELVIRDDGKGFDVADARRRAAHGDSLGIVGMEERVGLLDGTIDFSSAPGRGTTLHVRLPLHPLGLAADERAEP